MTSTLLPSANTKDEYLIDDEDTPIPGEQHPTADPPAEQEPVTSTPGEQHPTAV